MGQKLQILYLEDNPLDAKLVCSTLMQQNFDCQVTITNTKSKFLEALHTKNFDVILADYSLPSFDGLSALEEVKKASLQIPFIFISGTIGEELAIETLKKGATNYVLKDRLEPLVSIIKRALQEFREKLERQKAEQAWQVSEAQKRLILGCIPDTLLRLRNDGFILDFKASKDFEHKATAKKIADIFSFEICNYFMSYVEKTLQSQELQVFEIAIWHNHKMYEYEVRTVFCNRDEVLALLRNITQRKFLERKIVNISELKQKKLGQDMHDSLSQLLAGIKCLTKSLENKLSKKSLPEAANAAEIAKFINQALEETSALARGLCPVGLEKGGLRVALQNLVHSVQILFNISCEFCMDQEIEIESYSTCINLYRLTQEAIHNAINHGKAKKVMVTIYYKKNLYHLKITDDGIGFDTREKHQGMGLHVMKYRADILRSHLKIDSSLGKGTTVTCKFAVANGDYYG